MSENPIILLDVDDCLNATPAENPDWWFNHDFRSDPASGGYRLQLSQEMADALWGLNCEIRWLTTWTQTVDFANPNVGKAFGWPKLPALSMLDLPFGGIAAGDNDWKQLWVKETCKDPGPPVIWIDDDADYFIRHLGDLGTKDGLKWLDPHGRLFVVCPQEDVGITKAHIEMIEDFLAGRAPRLLKEVLVAKLPRYAGALQTHCLSKDGHLLAVKPWLDPDENGNPAVHVNTLDPLRPSIFGEYQTRAYPPDSKVSFYVVGDGTYNETRKFVLGPLVNSGADPTRLPLEFIAQRIAEQLELQKETLMAPSYESLGLETPPESQEQRIPIRASGVALAKPTKRDPENDWTDLTPVPPQNGVQKITVSQLRRGDCCFGSDHVPYVVSHCYASVVPGETDIRRVALTGERKGQDHPYGMVPSETEAFVFGNRGVEETLAFLALMRVRGFPKEELPVVVGTELATTSKIDPFALPEAAEEPDDDYIEIMGHRIKKIRDPAKPNEPPKAPDTQQRFLMRIDAWKASGRRLPRVQHALHWVLHNLIIHPLIAVLPVKFAFRAHDWSSRALTGKVEK